MSTKAVIGIVVAVVVIGAAAWHFSSKGTPGTENLGDTMREETAAGEGTYAELIGRAGSWKCTVSVNVEDAPSSGVAYISDGKVRGDFTSTVKGETYASHMIQADGYIYTWSDAYPQGMKMLIPEPGDTTSSSTGGVSYDSRVNYDCGPWMADASLFMAPANITFMELGASGIPEVPRPQ
jgi:hypothetical protein